MGVDKVQREGHRVVFKVEERKYSVEEARIYCEIKQVLEEQRKTKEHFNTQRKRTRLAVMCNIFVSCSVIYILLMLALAAVEVW